MSLLPDLRPRQPGNVCRLRPAPHRQRPGTRRSAMPACRPAKTMICSICARVSPAEISKITGEPRSTALFGLAAELPAALLARLLGIHISVAVAWQRASSGDWTAYAADYSRRQHGPADIGEGVEPSSRPRQPDRGPGLRTPSSPGGQDPRPLRAAPADPAPGAGPGRPGLPRRPCRHDRLDQVFHRAVQDVQQRHEDLQAQPFGPVLSAAGARARIGLNHANQPTRVRFRISGGDPEGIPGMDRGGTAKARESRVSLRRQAASMAGEHGIQAPALRTRCPAMRTPASRSRAPWTK